jgi:uncharacterized protein
MPNAQAFTTAGATACALPHYDCAMDSKLLDMLVCPVTKGPLRMSADKTELVSRSARLAYPIRDGIPIMLEDQARALSDDEIDAFTASSPAPSPAAGPAGV